MQIEARLEGLEGRAPKEDERQADRCRSKRNSVGYEEPHQLSYQRPVLEFETAGCGVKSGTMAHSSHSARYSIRAELCGGH